jgi:hypothetical protein
VGRCEKLEDIHRTMTFPQNEQGSEFLAAYPARKLNLGSGADIRDGYTNVDMHDYGLPNTLVGDVTDLPMIPNSSMNEIVAQDILEHIRFSETLPVLREWNRILEVSGRLYIRSTFLNGLVRLFEAPENQSISTQIMLLTNLFSRQLVPGDFHLTAFTEPLIRFYLWAAKFKIDSIEVKDGWIFEVWASKISDVYDSVLLFEEVSDAEFVTLAYQSILQRDPDASGATHFLEQLQQGARKIDVLKGLMQSDEHQKKLEGSFPATPLKFFQPA